MVSQQAKNTIPIYDIGTLADTKHLRGDITAEGFAHYLARHRNLKFPHRHSFYHLVYFTAGTGSHSIDFETFQIVPGQIYFMVPGQVHSWYFGEGIDGYIINFSEQLMYSFLKEGRYLEQFPFFCGAAADCVVQLQGATGDVERLLQQIIAEAAGNEPLATEMIRLCLLSLFIRVTRDMPQGIQSAVAAHNQLLLHNFRKLIEQYYINKRLPKDYAAMLFITPNHLNALCKEMLGKPAGELIRDRVLLEAKRLLVSPGITISEIAWQLSFSDNSYFTKFFKKYAGITPEQFREQVRHQQ